jgi:hypothetical protein
MKITTNEYHDLLAENARLREQLHSARYILQEISRETLAIESGLPMGVIVSAMENILANASDDRQLPGHTAQPQNQPLTG